MYFRIRIQIEILGFWNIFLIYATKSNFFLYQFIITLSFILVLNRLRFMIIIE